MRRQIGRLAILLVLGVATIAYGSLEKRVTVRIEGTPVAVRTFAGTVGGALERAGVEVGEGDVVQPSPAASISEGDVIKIRRAKDITLVVDGDVRREVVTALTINEALAEMGIDGSLMDDVRPPRTARVFDGMKIHYDPALKLVVHVEGKKKKIVTTADTVREVVDDLGIRLRKRDFLKPRGSTEVREGMHLRVMRVGVRKVTREQTIEHQTILRRVQDMEYGERKVIQEGRDGLKHVRLRIRYVNGEPLKRSVIREKVVRPAVTRIIAIGAGYPGCGACDNGTETGEATWYREADGLTAAHKTLPFGTVVRVVNLENGKSITVKIADRGPYADGRIIDLSDEAFRRLAPLSEGVIDVRISW